MNEMDGLYWSNPRRGYERARGDKAFSLCPPPLIIVRFGYVCR
eukprot:COSAG05_NODE_22584_length_264_cov_0.551515_1_plen_42_part_01